MTPEARAFFKDLPGELGTLGRAVHRLLMDHEPEFHCKKAWGGFAYLRGDNYSCLQAAYKDHIKLMIWRAADLPDPDKVLQGKGGNTRHLRLLPGEPLPETALSALLTAQFALYDAGERWEKAPEKRRAPAMPKDIEQALLAADCLNAYRDRPPYQQTDYLNWIGTAKREDTRQRRLEKMLAELSSGDVYMGQPWGRRSG